jgi:hypothetical protein
MSLGNHKFLEIIKVKADSFRNKLASLIAVKNTKQESITDTFVREAVTQNTIADNYKPNAFNFELKTNQSESENYLSEGNLTVNPFADTICTTKNKPEKKNEENSTANPFADTICTTIQKPKEKIEDNFVDEIRAEILKQKKNLVEIQDDLSDTIPTSPRQKAKISKEIYQEVSYIKDTIMSSSIKMKAENFIVKLPQNYHKNAKISSNLNSKEILIAENFKIYELNMLLGLFVLGTTDAIIIGGSNKSQVVNIMKKYSTVKYDYYCPDSVFKYDDISVNIYFNDEDTVSVLEFENDFKGSTNHGLKIGDTVKKALGIYGQPNINTSKTLSWNCFTAYCENSIITFMRIKN